MDLYDQEEQLRKGEERNEKLRQRLRWSDVPDKDIDKILSPLEGLGKYEQDKETTR